MTIFACLIISCFVFQVACQEVGEEKSFFDSQVINKILGNYMNEKPKELFKVWHYLYQKEYLISSEEAKNRFAIFKQNLARNQEINNSQKDFTVGVNQFSDMADDEFNQKYGTLKTGAPPVESSPEFQPFKEDNDDDDDLTKLRFLQDAPAISAIDNNAPALSAIDYRRYFGNIRNQGSCGSCWAFASEGAVEGNMGKKYNRRNEYYSPQQLLDCDSVSNGCSGGYMYAGLNYIRARGVQGDSSYPYKGYKSNCNYNSGQVRARISGYNYCSNWGSYRCSFTKVYQLLQRGPLAVGIDCTTYAFRAYRGGIFSATCYSENHAVILVGYGVSGTTQYWIIRNSWGPYWGESGYMKVKVNSGNKSSCFVEWDAYLPLV
jgi:xylem cysteine proteinase